MYPDRNVFEDSPFKEIIDIINQQPSQIYIKKSQSAQSLVRKTVYLACAQRFKEAEENVFLATRAIESDRNQLLREAEASEDSRRKEFYHFGAELYAEELKKMYSREI